MSSSSPSSLYEQDVRNNNGNVIIPSTNVQRRGSDTATQSFPLTDIDYESDPVAVAQELSNLQAIRRMSMDVNGMDPDLPAFNLSLGVPTVAPSHRSDEEDPSRLFWVPASVHPELAPNQFKSFIQERVRTLKRSSLSEQPLAPDSGGGGSLRRRKSMLSRQIDNGNGYEDGATRLERQKSQSGQPPLPVNLQELEDLIGDSSLVRSSIDSGSEVPISEDMPILPAKPAGQTLKRSTRTQYRRGSLKKGGVLPRRPTFKQYEQEQHDDRVDVTGSKPPQLPDVPALPDLSELANVTFGLTRVQTEPTPPPKSVENFSRPGRRAPANATPQSTPSSWSSGFDEAPAVQKPEIPQLGRTQNEEAQPQSSFHSRYANGRPTQYSQPIPQIIEPQLEELPPLQHVTRSNSLPVRAPERTSSMEQASPPPQGPLPRPGSQRPQPPRPLSLPQRTGAPNNHRHGNVTLDDIASSTSLLPGNSGRTESLSVIPTYADEGKKSDKKKSKDDGSRKPSWGWFSSSSSEEKEREKREKEEKEAAKRNKSKLQRPGEARHDNARLDVLQSSIDGGPRSRESAVFERHSLGIPDDGDNSKKSMRKTSGEVKKEKDPGLFSSFFGTSKRKTEREERSGGKKGSSLRGLSPDPPQRLLRPDLDYNWSRFSILEERAIYRLAHIKLANPRRELYSQVLLSNFMYSYLAKVQQMHPQIQIPQSAAQKQQQRQERQQQAKMLEEERKMRQQEADRQSMQQQQGGQGPVHNQLGVEEFAHYQRYQEVRPYIPPNTCLFSPN